ncbi:hypothetical protein RIF23_04995 [Lipingzhangella sp. LS1_29]|uniref:Secreted protein n=1 Tax=Lipingzhangella rawalii TaxID=2055835 RepID=A0ABU2H2X7_9ACTN|nr:hypothetical protein [Lipingzhangella rawalii]MDS1269646.1 hypothetical protein [Lipingzhangella rawalii]
MTVRLGMAIGAATAAVVLAALLVGWWALVGVAGLLLGGGLVWASRSTSPPPQPEPPPAPAPPPVAVEPEARERRKHIVRHPVPSARSDYHFLFSAVVCWYGEARDDTSAGAAAVTAVQEQVRTFLGNEQPEEYETVQSRLAAALDDIRCAHPDIRGLRVVDVRVELPTADEQRLEQLSEVRKRKAAREEERELERLERAYLGDDALADPGRAVVWWLARNPDRVDEAVGNISTLTRLSSAATGHEIPDVYRDLMRETGDRDSRPPDPALSGLSWLAPDPHLEHTSSGDSEALRPGWGSADTDSDTVDAPRPAPRGDTDTGEAPEGGSVPQLWRDWERVLEHECTDRDDESRERFLDEEVQRIHGRGHVALAAWLRRRFDIPDILEDHREPDDAPTSGEWDHEAQTPNPSDLAVQPPGGVGDAAYVGFADAMPEPTQAHRAQTAPTSDPLPQTSVEPPSRRESHPHSAPPEP